VFFVVQLCLFDVVVKLPLFNLVAELFSVGFKLLLLLFLELLFCVLDLNLHVCHAYLFYLSIEMQLLTVLFLLLFNTLIPIPDFFLRFQLLCRQFTFHPC